MPYLDQAGTEELWSKVKSNFAHNMTASTFTASGIDISLNSGMKTKATNEAGEEVDNWAQLSTVTIPTANSTTGGLVTPAQATAINNLAKVATSGKYSDLSGTPTIDTSLSTTSTNAVTNKAITTALSGKAATSHTHTKSQITDFPASLKNPSALTIGDVSYDGSAAKSITAGDNVTISSGKISATDTTYSAATTSAAGLMSASDKTKLDGVDYNANNYSLPKATTTTLGGVIVGDNLTVDLNGKINATSSKSYTGTAPINVSDDGVISHSTGAGYNHIPTGGDSFNVLKWCKNGVAEWDTIDAHEIDNLYADIYNKTQINTLLAEKPSSTDVSTMISAAMAGTASYGGTVSSADELTGKTYKKGNYYVVSVPTGSSWSGYENGDMFFAKQDKSGDTGSLDNFDVVQANITAMTTAEVDAICTLD